VSRWFAGILLIILLVGCAGDSNSEKPSAEKVDSLGALSPSTDDHGLVSVHIGDLVFRAAAAITPTDRTLGLSGRSSMPRDSGMLFVFETEGKFEFWMKDMEFPLDLIWIDSDCYITDITINAPPADNDSDVSDIISYGPRSQAQYVLEINGGLVETLGIQEGEPVAFDLGIGESSEC